MVLRSGRAGMASVALCLAAALLLLAGWSDVEARANKRHSVLDSLSTPPGGLSSARAAHHSRLFHARLSDYAAQLDQAADLLLLQLDERLEAETQAEARAATEGEEASDAGVDEQVDSESDSSSDGESEAASGSSASSGVDLDRELHRTWSEGDAKGLAHVLEHKHGVRLSGSQRAALVGQLEATMQVVSAAVDAGQPVDQAQLDATLDALLAKVVFPAPAKALLEHHSSHEQGQAQEHGADSEFGQLAEAEAAVMGHPEEPPAWIREVLLKAQKTLEINNKSSGFYQELVDGARQFAKQTDERVMRYTQPVEQTMEQILRAAMAKVDDKNSTLGRELRHIAAEHVIENDPAVNPGPGWAQEILADAVKALDDPKRTITKTLTTVAKDVVLQTDPSLDPGPTWAQQILAGAIRDVDQGKGEIEQALEDAAEVHELTHPEAPSTADLAHEVFTHIDENELEARLRFEARKQVFKEVVAKNRAKCERKMRRGQKCDMKQFIHSAYQGLDDIMHNRVPKVISRKKDKPLEASGQLAIARTKTSTPESVRDVELAIKGGIDPWMDLPGRQPKELFTKQKYVIDLLDGEAERCPKKCSLHGQCIMDMNSTVKSPSGSSNVHPFHCLCDKGYVGDACQIKLDMHLRWLLTEGAAPFPKCCNVCEKQREVPLKWDDIPTYNNPFAEFAPECQPFPRISMYSREDGSHELIKGRRPDPKCSHPLGEITRVDPIVALELASDLSAAQQLLQGGLLESLSTASSRTTSAAHIHHAARTLREASATARKAAQALALKLHLTDLTTVKYSSIDLDQLLEDYREMPNEMEECCLFCQLDKEPSTFMTQSDPGANVGPNAILNQDPRQDNAIDAVHRRQAMKRADRRHAQLTGEVPKSEQDCCVVCPYNFRELERLEEAAHVRKHQAAVGGADQEEMDKVFLETFAEVERDRRRRHEPVPCCPACPSQFLIAHAFPSNPWSTTRTMPHMGPA